MAKDSAIVSNGIKLLVRGKPFKWGTDPLYQYQSCLDGREDLEPLTLPSKIKHCCCAAAVIIIIIIIIIYYYYYWYFCSWCFCYYYYYYCFVIAVIIIIIIIII